MAGGEGKSRKRRSSPFSGEEEGRERRRPDKKESRRNSRDDREEEDDDGHKKRMNGKHSNRDKGKERDSKDKHSKEKEKEKSKRKEKGASSSNGGQPCSQFKAWALAHKGKATSDVNYNLEDPPSAYNNATVHNRLIGYTSMVRAVNEPEYDPSTQHLNGEVVMRVGGDKKYARYSIGDDTLDTATSPTLSQIRARSTSSSQAICPQIDIAQYRIEALKAQLKEMKREQEEMKRQREEMEASMAAMRQWMEQMFLWMQSIGEKIDLPLSSVPFHPPPPATTPNSAESNNGPH